MAIKTKGNPTTAGPGEARTKFGRIGVLMGGTSSEREISLKSGRAVFESLHKEHYDVVAIDVTTDDPRQAKELIRKHGIDCAFIALHGKFGEDGQIQAVLDELAIRYTGSGARASSQAMDKICAKKIFQSYGLPIPRFTVLDKKSFASLPGEDVACDFAFPWVVKPATQGSSIGMTIADSEAHVRAAIQTAFACDDRILIEEYIKGRELTVGILKKKPLSVIEIKTTKKFFDFEAKYQQGFTEYIVPACLDEAIARKVQDIALAAHVLLGCRGCSRVDIMLSDANVPYILEINTIPGLTATSLLPKAARCEGIDFHHLCLELLESAYEKE